MAKDTMHSSSDIASRSVCVIYHNCPWIYHNPLLTEQVQLASMKVTTFETTLAASYGWKVKTYIPCNATIYICISCSPIDASQSFANEIYIDKNFVDDQLTTKTMKITSLETLHIGI